MKRNAEERERTCDLLQKELNNTRISYEFEKEKLEKTINSEIVAKEQNEQLYK